MLGDRPVTLKAKLSVLAVLLALLLPVFAPWRRGLYLATLLVALVISLPLGLLWPVYLHQHAPEAFALWWNGQSLGSYAGMGAPRFPQRRDIM